MTAQGVEGGRTPRRHRPHTQHDRSALLPGEPRSRIDAAWMVFVYVCALMFIPANLTVAALGSVGTPALLFGLLALVWWIGAQMSRSFATLSPAQPVRLAALGFSLAVVASYVAAAVRPIETLELNAADRGLLLTASWLGIVLLTADGVTTVKRLEEALRLLVLAGGIVALLGIVQFYTSSAIVDAIQIPGLSVHKQIVSIFDRGGFNRVSGTATSPIEFGVVLSMLLPLALHFAFTDTHRKAILRWAPVATIAFAIPIAISRSALLGVAVGLIILIPTWPAVRRRISYLVILAMVAVVYVAIPGMLGTLIKLFTDISSDTSAESRTGSYALVWDFFTRSPLFGRGISTFLPEYRILDNQYLLLLIEVGIVGVIALVVYLVTAVVAAQSSRRRSTDPIVRSLGQSLTAAVVAGALSFATFDAFSFPQVSDLLFLCIGFIGALWNIVRLAPLREAARAAGSDPAKR
jgi:O-antigen ligase